MKHATASALDRLEPVLDLLRQTPGLSEKTRGVFYQGSKAFLHFHEDPGGLFADIRRPDGRFERFRVETDRERDTFVALLAALLDPD